MWFPRPPRPPAWYWRIPLRWRQRYARVLVWPWWAAWSLFRNVLTRRVLFGFLPEAAAFAWWMLRKNAEEAVAGQMRWGDAVAVPASYMAMCFRNWYGGTWRRYCDVHNA